MNIGEALLKAYNILKESNIESYMLDAQLLLCKVLKKDKMYIIMNRDCEISNDESEEFFELINLRRENMPVKYILGECEFMGINFKVKKGVLIPRPDTEVLVEDVIERINHNEFKHICDVCCGSGAIGLSIAYHVKESKVVMYDIAEEALDTTGENIKMLELEHKAKVQESDLLEEAIDENLKFDVVVSNPPYIRKEVIPTLMEDVKEYEPYIALCGGEDGLDFYRRISDESLKVLKRGGLLAYEIGHDQKDAVEGILKERGFTAIYSKKDLSGNYRVVGGYNNP